METKMDGRFVDMGKKWIGALLMWKKWMVVT
jgi:hypothetical protein